MTQWPQAIDPTDAPELKRCAGCDIDKPIEDFYPSVREAKTARCRKCMTNQQRETRKKKVKKKAKRPRGKPTSVSPEKLLASLAGKDEDPVYELLGGIIETQRLMLELVRERR